MTHDYEAALKRFNNFEKLDSPLIEAITTALSEMARMQKEGLVMVPREPTEVMLEAYKTQCVDEYFRTGRPWETLREGEIDSYKAMIAASQEKKDE